MPNVKAKSSSHKLVTIADAANALGVCTKTVRRMIERGEIEARRIGPRLIRIPADEVRRVGEAFGVDKVPVVELPKAEFGDERAFDVRFSPEYAHLVRVAVDDLYVRLLDGAASEDDVLNDLETLDRLQDVLRVLQVGCALAVEYDDMEVEPDDAA